MSESFEKAKKTIEVLIRKENSLETELREVRKTKKECLMILVEALGRRNQ